jgi:hypothetical protein
VVAVDYIHAVEALFPGARGQVLAALTRDTSSRTLRQVALAAEVSWSQTAQVIDDLADLGIVDRRQTPGAILVRLVPGNVVSDLVRSMTDLRVPVIDALRRAAVDIAPAPLNLTLFGSFARGEARRDSDVDVVAVHPLLCRSSDGSGFGDGSGKCFSTGAGSGFADGSGYGGGGDDHSAGWPDSIGRWVERATAVVGNPVNLVDLGEDELQTDRKPTGWLGQAAKEGVTLVGRPLAELLASHVTGRKQRA